MGVLEKVEAFNFKYLHVPCTQRTKNRVWRNSLQTYLCLSVSVESAYLPQEYNSLEWMFFIAFCIILIMKIHFASLKAHMCSSWGSYGLSSSPLEISIQRGSADLNGKRGGPRFHVSPCQERHVSQPLGPGRPHRIREREPWGNEGPFIFYFLIPECFELRRGHPGTRGVKKGSVYLRACYRAAKKRSSEQGPP